MASVSAWGLSWANAWGNSWGRIIPLVQFQPGGWLPIKYVKKSGALVDTLDEPEELPIPLDLDQPIVIPPEVLAAFFMPPDQTPQLMAEMNQARAELRYLRRRMQEEEDAALALLLVA